MQVFYELTTVSELFMKITFKNEDDNIQRSSAKNSLKSLKI